MSFKQSLIYLFIATISFTHRKKKREEIKREMASMTMAASFMGGGVMTKNPSASSSSTTRRSLIVAKAVSSSEGSGERGSLEISKGGEGSNGRRDLVFAGAAMAACTIANIAMADDEPKKGTPEAKKKYAPICVTMPTARICRN